MNIPNNIRLSDEKNLHIFNYVVDKAQVILSDSLFPHYTDHSIEHSKRVLNLASKLLGDYIFLSEDERFVLLCAIVLHDIGMQTNEYLSNSGFPLDNEQLESIRKKHHEFSFNYITEKYIALGLMDKQNLVHYIALVAKNHRVTDLRKVSKEEHFRSGVIRLQLLSAIIRLSDCLDCDSSRVNIFLLDSFKIEPKSKAYWFCHNYVQSIYIENRKANLVFAFPEEYKNNDIHNSIIDFMSTEVKSQTDKLYDILSTHGIVFHRELVSIEERYLKAIQPMPEDVYNYIKEYFNNPEGEAGAFNTFQKREEAIIHVLGKLNKPTEYNFLCFFGGISSTVLCTEETISKLSTWLTNNPAAVLYICYETGEAADWRMHNVESIEDPIAQGKMKIEKIIESRSFYPDQILDRICYIPISTPLTHHIIILNEDTIWTTLTEARSSITTAMQPQNTPAGKKSKKERLSYINNVLSKSSSDALLPLGTKTLIEYINHLIGSINTKELINTL